MGIFNRAGTRQMRETAQNLAKEIPTERKAIKIKEAENKKTNAGIEAWLDKKYDESKKQTPQKPGRLAWTTDKELKKHELLSNLFIKGHTVSKDEGDKAIATRKDLIKNLDDQIDNLTKVSGLDAEVLLRYLPVLMDNTESYPEIFKTEVIWSAQQVWQNYFLIGEEWDVAFYISMLLFSLKNYSEAITFLKHSIEL